MGLNDTEAALANSFVALRKGMLEMADGALSKQGFEKIKALPGYMPHLFSGAYTTILRVKNGNGKPGRILVAQGDSKAQMMAAIEYYKKNYDVHPDAIELPRRGLKDTAYRSNRVFNGFNELVARLAELDGDFAEAKKAADEFASEQVKKLYNFDVHEKRRYGAKGNLGDRPWLSAKENTTQFWEGVINWAEEGFKYYGYMDAFNQLEKLKTTPEVAKNFKNTLEYIDNYTKNIQGKNLGNVGAAANNMIDTLFGRMWGHSPKAAVAFIDATRQYSSAMMMGMINVGFLATQLTQAATGGLPEALKIRANVGLDGVDLAHSFWNLNKALPGLVLGEQAAKFGLDAHIPPHMKAAWDWAHTHGMFDLSEAVLARDALKPPGVRALEKYSTVPMWLGEKLTRPPVFLLYADMFEKAGFKGEEAFLRAQEATDYAMANYHPDERATIYSQLGVMGQYFGALATYKHNLMDQWYTRIKDIKQGEITPVGSMIGMMFAFYGVSGLPGYQEADQLVRQLVGKSIRELFQPVLEESTLWDGYASYKTGFDISSRLSMASILPDDPLAAAPHASNIWKMISSGYEAGKNKDMNSVYNAAYNVTPSGMRGMTESLVRKDEQGYVLEKNAQRKYDEPRSKEDWRVREWTGIRPLKEKLTDERIFSQKETYKRLTDKQKNQVGIMENAIRRGDHSSFETAKDKYMELEGDPSIFNNGFFERAIIEGKKSQKQRMEGVPTDTLGSIRRYRAFNPGE